MIKVSVHKDVNYICTKNYNHMCTKHEGSKMCEVNIDRIKGKKKPQLYHNSRRL